jgi:outer membrane protein assembly factor BamD (BamD/ComL family)
LTGEEKNDTRDEEIMRTLMEKGLILSLILCFLSGCAYYNTFYNAKVAYGNAMKAKENSANKKAPADLLDKVIEKCGKVIKYHSKSRWVDDAIVLMGKAYLEKGEYDKALRKFEELSIYYPESPFIDEVQYLAGVTYFERGDYSLAVGAFRRVLELQESKQRDAAAYKIIECYYENEEYDNLLAAGREFEQEYERSSYLPRILLLMGSGYIAMDDYENATKVLEVARSRAKRREDKNDIEERYAVALIRTGNIDEGLGILKELSERTLVEERTATLTFEIVDAYLEEDNGEKAMKELDNFISLYSSGPNAAEAFYRKGLIYEEQGSIDEAITAYENATKLNPRKEIGDAAAKRALVLHEIKSFREQLANPDSTIDVPKTHFLLAETYLFGKGNVDTALVEYGNVLEQFPQHEVAPKAALAIAWIHEYKRKDVVRAADMYERIIQDYPATRYAEVALEALTRLGKNVDDKGPEGVKAHEGGANSP